MPDPLREQYLAWSKQKSSAYAVLLTVDKDRVGTLMEGYVAQAVDVVLQQLAPAANFLVVPAASLGDACPILHENNQQAKK
eukprot:6122184-Prymnesium_polylepis.1